MCEVLPDKGSVQFIGELYSKEAKALDNPLFFKASVSSGINVKVGEVLEFKIKKIYPTSPYLRSQNLAANLDINPFRVIQRKNTLRESLREKSEYVMQERFPKDVTALLS